MLRLLDVILERKGENVGTDQGISEVQALHYEDVEGLEEPSRQKGPTLEAGENWELREALKDRGESLCKGPVLRELRKK